MSILNPLGLAEQAAEMFAQGGESSLCDHSPKNGSAADDLRSCMDVPSTVAIDPCYPCDLR